MNIKIITDSTCDLPQHIVSQHGITVVPVFINMDGKSYKDGIELSRQEFYEKLPSCKAIPTTSAPGIAAFVEEFKRLAAEGATHIFSIHISSSLSNITNVARMAAESFDEVPVTVIDSGQLTMGLGLIVLEAAKAAEKNTPAKEIEEMIFNARKSTFSYALLDTLDYLRKGGRISFLQHNLATLLNIKPLLIMHNGELIMEKVRTHKRAVNKMIQHVVSLGPVQTMALVHANSIKRVETLKSQIHDVFTNMEIPLLGEVTPAIGSHVGPGSVGVIVLLQS